MNNSKTVDIHTHTIPKENSGIFVYNIEIEKYQNDLSNLSIDFLFSAGIHPWNIKNDHTYTAEFELLEKIISKKSCLFVGETGIDLTHRNCRETKQKQIEIFERHIDFAKKFHKPLIIHAVKTYDLVLSYLDRFKFHNPIIFHDYNGSSTTTKKILKFDSYFSLGSTLFRSNSLVTKQILDGLITLEHSFLETDASNRSIQEVYIRLGEIISKNEGEIQNQLYLNFKKITSDLNSGGEIN